jgi:predicted DCC family thiol-disulfide oxidoreductase YuxK
MKFHLPVVLYDPDCPLCLRFKQGLEHLDRNLTFVSARDPEVYLEFTELDPVYCLEKVHLVTADRVVLVGPEVIDHLIRTLPAVSKLAWLLENEQGKKVKEFFYQKVEELRELSKKKDSDCGTCPKG